MNPLGQTVGSRFAEQLALRMLTPAFAFWAGGALVLSTAGYGHDWPHRLGALPTVLQLTLLAAVVALVAGSAVVADHLCPWVLRLLEGYWPAPLARPLRRLTDARAERADKRLQVLSSLAYRGVLDNERRLAAVETRLHDLPAAGSVMPTRLGNILRAAEDRPRERYGLDPVVCWPHLWLLLDKQTQEEIAHARRQLDDSAQLWLWCLLFVSWTWWAWWAPLVAVIGCAVIYYGALLARARAYGMLMQAAYDLYRQRIYRALNWPTAADPASEPAVGAALTNYLWRGITPPDARFASPDPGVPGPG